MHVAVNAIFLQKDQLEGYGHYVRELSRRMAEQHPQDSFCLLFDRPYDHSFVTGDNVTAIVTGPPARHAFAFRFWYDITAPRALKAFKPDVWFQPYGFCSLTTGVPQLLVVHDLSFLHYPQFIPRHHRWFYRLFTKRFLKKAKHIVTVSEFSRKDIIEHYKIPSEKISVIPNAASEKFKPVSWQEKQQIKIEYTGGREYFLCTGGIHPRKNILNLLKAFSQFKKWQQSNMKLVIAGRLAWDYEDIAGKLQSFKYRDDVVVMGYVSDEQLVNLIAGAYAMVYPSWFEGFGIPILEAMRSGVPVIASSTSAMPETGGDAALYADPSDPQAIAKHMITLYRDETYRSQLIDAGLARAEMFSWDDAARALYDVMQKMQ